jgi:polar amino acid transport system substrate-binding protein
MIKQAILSICIACPAVAGRSADLRFVLDQTTSMPLSQIVQQDGALIVRGGILADLERAVARNLGVEAVLIATPRKRVERFLGNGGGDVLCYYDPVWLSDAAQYRWSDVFLSNTNLLIAGANVPLPDRIGELERGRIGTIIGYVYPELAELAGRRAVTRDDAPDDQANFRKLVAGRTDYLVTHALFFDYMLRTQPDTVRRLGGKLEIRRFETRCALSKSAPVSVERFNAALAQLRASGEYDAILAKYR